MYKTGKTVKHGSRYLRKTLMDVVMTIMIHIIQSMSRKGNCMDNSIMKCFFGKLKNEMFYGHEDDFDSLNELEKSIEGYIYYYNNKRIKLKNKGLPPILYRQQSLNILSL